MPSTGVRLIAVGAAAGLIGAAATVWVAGRRPERTPPQAAATRQHRFEHHHPSAPAPAPIPQTQATVGGRLPASARRGPIGALQQYPTPSLATPEQRIAAVRLLAQIRSAARPWSTARRAAAAGFAMHHVHHSTTIGYLHAENHGNSHDRHFLDPRRPEALIYANGAGRLTLVGAMFSMPRHTRGRTPGGPITRWHTHRVCARGSKRGLAPRPDGTCPPGTTAIQGSEMLHVWFTRDLRSAFAIHAPEPELCRDGLLPVDYCRRIGA